MKQSGDDTILIIRVYGNWNACAYTMQSSVKVNLEYGETMKRTSSNNL